jgi:hypothetical protein
MTQVAGYHTHKLTVYLPSGEDTYQLKPWLVLDRENDLVVVRSSHHTRPQAMMWMFRNLTCKGQGGFCFVNNKEQVHVDRI